MMVLVLPPVEGAAIANGVTEWVGLGGVLVDGNLICPNCGASASLPFEMQCDDHRPTTWHPIGSRHAMIPESGTYVVATTGETGKVLGTVRVDFLPLVDESACPDDPHVYQMNGNLWRCAGWELDDRRDISACLPFGDWSGCCGRFTHFAAIATELRPNDRDGYLFQPRVGEVQQMHGPYAMSSPAHFTAPARPCVLALGDER